MDFNEIVSFLIAHWQLSGIFVVLLVILIIEEVRVQGGSQRVSPAQLVSLINQDNAYIVDLRDPSMYTAGHIVGSHNMTKADLTAHVDRLPKEDSVSIVLLCQRGQASLNAFNELKKKGLTNIKILKGGVDAWRQASMPLVNSQKVKVKKDKKLKKEKSNG